MKLKDAITALRLLDRKGRYVFTKHDLHKFFLDENSKTFSESLNRLVKKGILRRACRGIYVNENAMSFGSYTLELITKALRRGKYNYVSLESMLSEYGVISQIPIDRLTVMTSGREGTYKTPYGIIELTHTKRSIKDILSNSSNVIDRPLRIAHKNTAYRDLKRVGRNTHLVDIDELLEATPLEENLETVKSGSLYELSYGNIKLRNIHYG